MEKIADEKHLTKALFSGRSLRIKYGIDPTGPRLHLGRSAALWKLRFFQEMGHKIVFIIGDFTARIGDASDKQAMRRTLTPDQISVNMKNYKRLAGKILDISKTEVRYNSDWLGKMKIDELLRLASRFTAQQMIQRRNFKERWQGLRPIGLHEILYPLLQGFDSHAVKADVEMGGSDQLFNLETGREIQRIYGEKPQDIITLRMLTGIDGRKMSTSWGNCVYIDDPPQEQFGKIMRLRDELLEEYLVLASDIKEEEVRGLIRRLRQKNINPKDVKTVLAHRIVKMYHGEVLAKEAKDEFRKVFTERSLPLSVPIVKIKRGSSSLVDLLVLTRLAGSRGEARRLIKQGGVRVNGETNLDVSQKLMPTKGMTVAVGKRKIIKLRVA